RRLAVDAHEAAPDLPPHEALVPLGEQQAEELVELESRSILRDDEVLAHPAPPPLVDPDSAERAPRASPEERNARPARSMDPSARISGLSTPTKGRFRYLPARSSP